MDMNEFKIIHDAVHGSIKLEEPLLSLLGTPEMQRMSGIRQLGLNYLIFPGANHTRLEHAIGVAYLGDVVARTLRLKHEETLLLLIAALLHDIGHSPYSHSLENLLYSHTGKNHMEIAKDIILGNLKVVVDEYRSEYTLREILDKYNIDINKVCDIITGAKKATNTLDIYVDKTGQSYFSPPDLYIYQIINGSLDIDQLDYLVRDSHYTGVAYGIIDIPRIINTLRIFNGAIAIDKKGISAVESVFVARALMYTAVYFHKTAKIAELMLSRGVEELHLQDFKELYRLNDSELISALINSEGYSREIGLRLKYRKLFKKAVIKRFEELSDAQIMQIMKYTEHSKKRQLENEIAQEAGAAEGEVLIDIPEKKVLTEPRLNDITIPIFDQGNVKNITTLSPIVKALLSRRLVDWTIMVVTPAPLVDKVKKIVKRYF